MVADAYFSKKPLVDAILSAGQHLISRLRDDSVLRYKYYGEQTGKQGSMLISAEKYTVYLKMQSTD